MKTRILLGIMLFSVQTLFAQDKILLSLGGGSAHTINSGKNQQAGDGFNIQADAFLPFYQKGWNKGAGDNGFSLGIYIGGSYSGVNNISPDDNGTALQYQVYSATNTVSTTKTGSRSGFLSGQAGVQALFKMNKFRISPVISAGYTQATIQGFTQTGNYSANGTTQSLELQKREKQNDNWFTVKPQLRLGYQLNSTLSLFANTAIVMGPEMNTVTSAWVPEGGFNDKKIYEPQQMRNGAWSGSINTDRYKTVEINLGLTVVIGKKKTGGRKGSGAVSSSYAKNVTPGTGAGTPQNSSATDFNTTRSNRDNRLSTDPGNDSLPGNTLSAEAANNRVVKQDSGSTMPTRLSMTPTMTRQSQGQTFGEKVNQGLAVNDPVNPLYEGKGTENTNPLAERKNGTGGGKATLKDMTITKRESGVADPSGKSISEKGLKRNETAARQTPNTSFGQRTVLVAGQPIGGIVVKGGKNPGGNIQNLLTNENGEVIFTANETGLYTFRITAPEEQDANERRVEVLKSNKTGDPNPAANKKDTRTYTGGRKNEASGAAVMIAGNPIGGIIVKGGKNPGGNAINTLTNANGDISFSIDEAGEYKLQLIAPEAGGKSINEKGVSGSKPKSK